MFSRPPEILRETIPRDVLAGRDASVNTPWIAFRDKMPLYIRYVPRLKAPGVKLCASRSGGTHALSENTPAQFLRSFSITLLRISLS